MSLLEQIRRMLTEAGCTFREVDHEPTTTSEQSALARGEPLGVGAKALLLKTDEAFRLFVIPADRKLDSSAVKKQLKVKTVRFATAEELLQLTGLVPGSVPPFGHPVLPFELFADETMGHQFGRVAFNAGSLTNSVVMNADDWERLAKPMRVAISRS